MHAHTNIYIYIHVHHTSSYNIKIQTEVLSFESCLDVSLKVFFIPSQEVQTLPPSPGGRKVAKHPRPVSPNAFLRNRPTSPSRSPSPTKGPKSESDSGHSRSQSPAPAVTWPGISFFFRLVKVGKWQMYADVVCSAAFDPRCAASCRKLRRQEFDLVHLAPT